ncbi:hypothetical protein HPB51_005386 [Rhipicephalus microplus]|uniref:Uncharacterized protein n=1 Tax=Rhipicephalus microplus TaxID=6941 RepID=A0A9J6DFU6_RHIMP|nr:hypothetical protein HPB51_005386 [Rhipicephalus microplus]
MQRVRRRNCPGQRPTHNVEANGAKVVSSGRQWCPEEDSIGRPHGLVQGVPQEGPKDYSSADETAELLGTYLRDNRIRQIAADTFVSSKNLRHLDLRSCSLTDVQEDLFVHPKNLTHLNLAYNKLSDVTGAFTVLGSLRTLDLEGNRLDLIPDDTFWPLRSIESL